MIGLIIDQKMYWKAARCLGYQHNTCLPHLVPEQSGVVTQWLVSYIVGVSVNKATSIMCSLADLLNVILK